MSPLSSHALLRLCLHLGPWRGTLIGALEVAAALRAFAGVKVIRGRLVGGSPAAAAVRVRALPQAPGPRRS